MKKQLFKNITSYCILLIPISVFAQTAADQPIDIINDTVNKNLDHLNIDFNKDHVIGINIKTDDSTTFIKNSSISARGFETHGIVLGNQEPGYIRNNLYLNNIGIALTSNYGSGILLESPPTMKNLTENNNINNDVFINGGRISINREGGHGDLFGIMNTQEGTSLNINDITIKGNGATSIFDTVINNKSFYDENSEGYKYDNKIYQSKININDKVIFENDATDTQTSHGVINLAETFNEDKIRQEDVKILDPNSGKEVGYHKFTVANAINVIGKFHQTKEAGLGSKVLLNVLARWDVNLGNNSKLYGESGYDSIDGINMLNGGKIEASNLNIIIMSNQKGYRENEILQRGSAILLQNGTNGDFFATNINAINAGGLSIYNSKVNYTGGNINSDFYHIPSTDISAAVFANSSGGNKNNAEINLKGTKVVINNKSAQSGESVSGIASRSDSPNKNIDNAIINADDVQINVLGRANGIIADNGDVKLKGSDILKESFNDGYSLISSDNGKISVTGKSNIYGKIKSKNKGNININIYDGFITTESEKDKTSITNIGLKDKSLLNIVGDSSFTNLSSENSVIIFKRSLKNKRFTTTTVDNLSGNRGTYNFAVDVVNQTGSKLIINTSSDGTHIAQGLNDGEQKSTGKEKVTLIEDKSGVKAKAIFNSGKDVELGGYTYTVQRDTDNPDNWVLVAKTKPVPPKPVINDTAKTITGLASTSYLINQAEMTTLRQRMGDLTQSSGIASQKDVSGAWGRMYGGNYKTRNNDNLTRADMNYYGFQLGGDVNTAHYSDNKNYLGLFAGHTTGKPNYVRGNATATSWYGGFYDTFISDNGFYVDSVIKLGQYRNKYNLKDSQDNALNGNASSTIITLSSQTGKRFILTENNRYNVYAEPQAQLTYSRIGTFNTTASNGLRVKQGAYNSTVGRLGLLLGTQINKQSDIYLKTSYLHEFSKDVKYTLNDSPESYSVKGDGLETGLGINVKVKDNGYLYAEGNYTNSKSHYTGSKFNIGYRYNF